MKKALSTILLLAITLFATPVILNSQEDALFNACLDQLKSPFIASGQPNKAFLTGTEVAEFHTTFFTGSIYRIAACSHQANNIIFSVYDKNRNLLFTNENHELASYWDFKAEGSIECVIEARLNSNKTTSAIAMLMIGFKSSEDK